MTEMTRDRHWAETVTFVVNTVKHKGDSDISKIMKEGAALADVFSEASAQVLRC